MKDKTFDKFKKTKFGEGLTKETVKARYENLKEEKKKKAIALRENLADIKIKKAIADGEFDNLPGKGKPIDLKNYHDLPEHLRVAYQMLKNSGFVPEEVRLKKEMEILKKKIKECKSEDKKRNLMIKLAKVSEQYHFCMEYNKGFKNTFY